MGCATSSKTKSLTDTTIPNTGDQFDFRRAAEILARKDQIPKGKGKQKVFNIKTGRYETVGKRGILGRTLMAQVNIRGTVNQQANEPGQSCHCHPVYSHGYHHGHHTNGQLGHCSHTHQVHTSLPGTSQGGHAGLMIQRGIAVPQPQSANRQEDHSNCTTTHCQHNYQLMIYQQAVTSAMQQVVSGNRPAVNTSITRGGENRGVANQSGSGQGPGVRRKSRSRSRSRNREDQKMLKEEYELLAKAAKIEGAVSKPDELDDISDASEIQRSSVTEFEYENSNIDAVKTVIDSVIDAALDVMKQDFEVSVDDSDKTNVTHETGFQDDEHEDSDEDSGSENAKVLTSKIMAAKRDYFAYAAQIQMDSEDEFEKRKGVLSQSRAKSKKEIVSGELPPITDFTVRNTEADEAATPDISQDVEAVSNTHKGDTVTRKSADTDLIKDGRKKNEESSPSTSVIRTTRNTMPIAIRYRDIETGPATSTNTFRSNPGAAMRDTHLASNTEGPDHIPGDVAATMNAHQEWWQAGRESGWRDGWVAGYHDGHREAWGGAGAESFSVDAGDRG